MPGRRGKQADNGARASSAGLYLGQTCCFPSSSSSYSFTGLINRLNPYSPREPFPLNPKHTRTNKTARHTSVATQQPQETSRNLSNYTTPSAPALRPLSALGLTPRPPFHPPDSKIPKHTTMGSSTLDALSAYALPPLPSLALPPLPPINDPEYYEIVTTHASLRKSAHSNHELNPKVMLKDYEKLEHVGDALLGAYRILYRRAFRLALCGHGCFWRGTCALSGHVAFVSCRERKSKEVGHDDHELTE